MKKFKKFLTLLTLIISIFTLSSCSKSDKLKFGTGNEGGNYHSYGSMLATQLYEQDNINIKVVETAGSVANLRLISEGFVDLAIVQADTVQEGIDNGLTNFHTSKTLFIENIQLIVKSDSSISSIADLKGKRVNFGEEESGTEKNAIKLLELGGIELKQINKTNFSFIDSANALADGSIDALFITSPSITNALSEISKYTSIRPIGIDDAIITAFTTNSVFESSIIKANTYNGQTSEVKTVGVPAVLVFNDKVDKNIETKIVNYVEANNDNLKDISFGERSIIIDDGPMSYDVDLYLTMLIAVLMLFLGKFLRKKIKILDRFCIPAPVIGGLIFCIFSLILYETGICELYFDGTLKDICMMIFFTTVGFQANAKVLKKGGIGLIKMVGLIFALITLQNLTALGLSKLLKVDTLIAMCTGSIPMIGGHGTSAAFGKVLESLGCKGAITIASASATFGLIAGSIIGGPLGRSLIKKYNLKSTDKVEDQENEKETKNEVKSYANAVFQLAIAMGLGTIVSALLSLTGLTFPGYVGSMIVAAIMRNISEYSKKYETPMKHLDDIGNISLSLFLGMAMITLKLWQLADLALPLVVLLLGQVLLTFLFVRFVVYNVMGRNYDAAIMSAGACGFGMGATPNAMANMDAVTQNYGPSIQAYVVIPIAGAMLVDFINSIVITLFINLL